MEKILSLEAWLKKSVVLFHFTQGAGSKLPTVAARFRSCPRLTFHACIRTLTAGSLSHRETPHQRSSSMAHQVLFKGSPKDLVGPKLKAGDSAPEFECVSPGLEVITLASTPKKARLFSIVPSLDTPVCSTQTKKCDEAS